MASDKSTSSGNFDDRLQEALNSALQSGENVVAQEAGDQGQAIALTSSRLIIIKTGFTATGEIHGQRVVAYPLEAVTAINVRKGPLGAVIQICGESGMEPVPGAPPDNVIIFTGSQRVKKCEAFAAKVEAAIGKSVNKVDCETHPDDTEETLEVVDVAPVDEPVAVDEPEVVSDDIVIIEEAAPPAVEPPVIEAVAEPEPVAEPAVESESEPPAPRKGGREARSLADEMFSEMSAQQNASSAHSFPVSPDDIEAQAKAKPEPEPAPQPKPKPKREPKPEPEPVIAEAALEPEPPAPEPAPAAPVAEVVEEPKEPSSEFRPNPRLPKPVRKQKSGPNKVLVLMGVLAVLVLLGMAVMAPMQDAPATNKIDSQPTDNSSEMKSIQLQITATSDYRSKVKDIISKTDSEVAAFRNALRTGSKSGIQSVSQPSKCDDAWSKLSELEAPPGLASSKEALTGGMFIRKNTMAIAIGHAHSAEPMNTKESLGRLADADTQIKNGLSTIDSSLAKFQKQVSQLSPQKK